MSHGSAAPETPFVPGPERIAVLRKAHGIGAAFGLTAWLGAFVLLAIVLDGRARAALAEKAMPLGMTPADYAALNHLPAGLGVRALTMLVGFGLIFGLACHRMNRKALEKLPA